MILNKKMRDDLIKKYLIYCEIMKLKERPDLCIDVIEGTGTKRDNTETLDGGYALELNLIFIVPSRVNSLFQLEETLVHELIHCKYPKLRHGKKFNDKVYEIMDQRIRES